MTGESSWDFARSFPALRRSALLADVSSDEIRRRIEREARDFVVSLEPGEDPGLTGALRPVFTFDVDPETFDLYFNGPQGYRAAYLRHPEFGQAANNLIVAMLQERLIKEASRSHACRDVPEKQLRQSLLGGSAKIWLNEDHFPFRAPSEDLEIAPWIEAKKAGEEKAAWGLCAPEGRSLRIMGAFVDDMDNEIVPRRKVARRFELNRYGFS